MRYQLTGPFVIGQFEIPTGVVVDDVAGTDQWSALVRAAGSPTPPLFVAVCLDQTTFDSMAATYFPIDPSLLNLIQAGPNVNRGNSGMGSS
jgi:hypothetical protein